MKKKAFLAVVCISSASFSGCTTGPANTNTILNAPSNASDTQPAIFNDEYLKANKILPISFINLSLSHISSRYQENAVVDQKMTKETTEFLSLTNPSFNRLLQARKVSGKGPDAVPDEVVVEKYKPQVIAMAPKAEVYVDVNVSLEIIRRGELMSQYDDTARGIKVAYGFKSFLSPYSRQEFANQDYAGEIVLNPGDFNLSIPYIKTEFQKHVHDAILSNQPLIKMYRVRLILKIVDCVQSKKGSRYDSGIITCKPQLVDYQVFEGSEPRTNRLLKTASVRLGPSYPIHKY